MGSLTLNAKTARYFSFTTNDSKRRKLTCDAFGPKLPFAPLTVVVMPPLKLDVGNKKLRYDIEKNCLQLWAADR